MLYNDIKLTNKTQANKKAAVAAAAFNYRND
jgi:hypothetical protein